MKMLVLAALTALSLGTAYAQDVPANAATQGAGYQQGATSTTAKTFDSDWANG